MKRSTTFLLALLTFSVLVTGCDDSPTAPVPDGDKDGVSDVVDLCPGTPIGTAVNSTGCPAEDDDAPVDTDGDGVIDSLDACPRHADDDCVMGVEVTTSVSTEETRIDLTVLYVSVRYGTPLNLCAFSTESQLFFDGAPFSEIKFGRTVSFNTQKVCGTFSVEVSSTAADGCLFKDGSQRYFEEVTDVVVPDDLCL